MATLMAPFHAHFTVDVTPGWWTSRCQLKEHYPDGKGQAIRARAAALAVSAFGGFVVSLRWSTGALILDVALRTEDTREALEAELDRLKSELNALVPYDVERHPDGSRSIVIRPPTTTVQKVEIVLTNNGDPSRVAREIEELLFALKRRSELKPTEGGTR